MIGEKFLRITPWRRPRSVFRFQRPVETQTVARSRIVRPYSEAASIASAGGLRAVVVRHRHRHHRHRRLSYGPAYSGFVSARLPPPQRTICRRYRAVEGYVIDRFCSQRPPQKYEALAPAIPRNMSFNELSVKVRNILSASRAGLRCHECFFIQAT
jgi:hypothetical protein